MEIFGLILASWIALLGLAILGGYGKAFANWSWGIVSGPFRVFWGHYGSYILMLLFGVLLGVCYAPAIRSSLGY